MMKGAKVFPQIKSGPIHKTITFRGRVSSMRKNFSSTVAPLQNMTTTLFSEEEPGWEEAQRAAEETAYYELCMSSLENVIVGPPPLLRFMGAPAEVLKTLEDRYRVERSTRYRGAWVILVVLIFLYEILVTGKTIVNEGFKGLTTAYLIEYAGMICALWFILSPLWAKYCQPGVAVMCVLSAVHIGALQLKSDDFSNMMWALLTVVTLSASPLLVVMGWAVIGLITMAFLIFVYFVAHRAEGGIEQAKFDLLALTVFVVIFTLALSRRSVAGQCSERKAVATRLKTIGNAIQLENEALRTKELLASMVPEQISDRIKELSESNSDIVRNSCVAESFESVTVMFVEVCDFNRVAARLTRVELLGVLDIIYSYFDQLVPQYNMHKIETIGPIYLAVGGCPNRDKDHATHAAFLALAMQRSMQAINRRIKHAVPSISQQVQIRVGLNSGPVTTGVVGTISPRYKLFGDTVNTASRMGSNCAPSVIQCSEKCARLLRMSSSGTFVLVNAGTIKVKGKGEMKPFLLLGSNSDKKESETANSRTTAGEIEESIGDYATFLGRQPSSANRLAAVDKVDAGRAPSSTKLELLGKETAADFPKTRVLSRSVSAENNGFSREDESIQFMSLSRFKWRPYLVAVSRGFLPSSADFLAQRADAGLKQARKLAYYVSILFLLLTIAISIILALPLTKNLPRPSGNARSDFWTFRTFYFGLAGSVCGLVMSLLILQASRKKSLFAVRVLLLFAMLLTTGSLAYVNFIGTRFNSSGLMAACAFFFYLDAMPFPLRLFVTQLCCIGYCGFLISLTFQYPHRYAAPKTKTSLQVYSIMSHLSMLTCANIMQMLCVATHESALLTDFIRDIKLRKQRTELEEKRAESKAALNQLLPPTIVARLLSKERTERIVDSFETVTILFTDMVGFTSFSSKIDSLSLMEFLNLMYSRFDEISSKYGLYKVEVIGDAYFAVAGCPEPCNDHTERAVSAALEMLECLPELQVLANKILARVAESEGLPEPAVATISIRVGVHVGPAIAGVVGIRDPRYHLFGETVGLAQEFESNSQSGKVHASWGLVHELQKTGADANFEIIPREPVDFRPLGPVQVTYLINKLGPQVPGANTAWESVSARATPEAVIQEIPKEPKEEQHKEDSREDKEAKKEEEEMEAMELDEAAKETV